MDKNLENPGKKPLKMATVDHFRIRRYDSMNWVLEEFTPGGLHPVTREQALNKWIVIGYYGQLSDLTRHLLDRSIILPDKATGQQILDAIKEAEQHITASLIVVTK